MKLSYMGGALEVGASAILIKLDNKNILLDSGIRQKKNIDKLPDFSQIAKFGGIDAIVISHAHLDHIGSLPLISKEYPSATIYMNRMTKELSQVLLYDSLKIMNYQEGEIPVFNEVDVQNMLNKIELVPYQKEITILENITLTFYMAGHIAGACCCYLKSKEGTVFYTGDFSLFPQYTISGLSIPKLRPDVLISEATYGDKLHANRESEEMHLIDAVNKIITSEGKVLIPVFALGRSQEVLLILKKAMNKGIIKKVPIYIDGMVRNINTVFQNNPLFLKENLGRKIFRGTDIFYNDSIIRVEDDNQRKKITDLNMPCIIIASSGMLTGGMSEYYATKIVENSKNGIILTGYQDEESNGSVLLNLLDEPLEQRRLKLNNKVYQVLCSIDKVGLSAHADKQEMKSLFDLLKPKYIILGHGEETIIESLALEVTRDIHSKVYTPRIGELIELEIRNPRKQVDYKLEYLYSNNGNIEDFYYFIKEHYGNRLFTIEDLAYIYYGKNVSEEEVNNFMNNMTNTPYFSHDKRRYFLFRITDELELEELKNKEITVQDIEIVLKDKFTDFPYKKISYYLNEKRVVLTFDFPKVINDNFNKISEEIFDEYGIIVEKNDGINNRACEVVITNVLGSDNIDKISYLPLEDRFYVKVYNLNLEATDKIKELIGYDVELVLVPKKIKDIMNDIVPNGQKLEQNEALAYIDKYFSDKKHKPYKKSIKNGNLVLSFISYEISLLYLENLKIIEQDIKWNIELNHAANMNMIFNTLDELLNKYNLIKIKNSSYLPVTNSVNVKLDKIASTIEKDLKADFKDLTGLDLSIEV